MLVVTNMSLSVSKKMMVNMRNGGFHMNRLVTLLAAAPLIMCSLASMAAPDIQDAVQTKIRDISLTMNQNTSNRRELEKISRDFSNAYRIQTLSAYYKEPLKMLIKSKVGFVSVSYIVNGDERLARAGVIKDRENIASSPGKRNCLFDLGILTPSFMKLARFEYVGKEGDTTIWDMRWATPKDKRRNRLYIDMDHKIIIKRIQYEGDGSIRGIFTYKNHYELASGVWVPRISEAINSDNKLGGTTSYKDYKLNSGLSDSMFDI